MRAQFGAACGLLLGHGVRAAVIAIGGEGSHPASLQLYAVVGAAAFLAGSVRYKAAAVLITMETTGAWVLAVPITIAGALLCHALLQACGDILRAWALGQASPAH